MYKPSLLLFVCLMTGIFCFGQLQTADGEGITQASTLKKISKKAQYGAYTIDRKISFATAKGINDEPVVTAEDNGIIEMVSMENKAFVGYLLPYNNFLKLRDYDFEVFYKNSFKSQKYPPEKISLTNESIFFDDNYGQFYGFQATESGQRCRFRYNYEYTDAKYLTRIFFHEGIPIHSKTISFKVPSWLELEITERNFENYKIKKEVKKDKDFTIYTYTAENLSPLKQESSSLARPYYLPHLIITVRSFNSGGKKYNGFKTLDDMYAWYNFLYHKASNTPDVLKTQVSQLTEGKASDEEKIKSIYYWVQDNIRYIAFEEGYAGFIPQTVQEVYKNKYGDCKGMANLLTEMLKLAGYDAHFAWIGTREIPYDRQEVQSLCVDNHAICVLYFKGKTYFIDGTEKYAPFGKDAYRIQGKSALVENGSTYKVEKVPPPSPVENPILTNAQLKLDGEKISGHVKMTFDGEAKNFFHYIYNNIPSNKRKEFVNELVKLGNDNAEASNVKTSDFANRDIPLVLEGDIEINNQVTIADSLCYTSIDFFPGTLLNFIPEEERQNPIDMDHVFLSTDEVVLTLPAGAKAQSMPKPFKAAFKENSIDASYTAGKNNIELKKSMVLSSPVIQTTDFTAWKDFLNKIKAFNRNSIAIQLQ